MNVHLTWGNLSFIVNRELCYKFLILYFVTSIYLRVAKTLEICMDVHYLDLLWLSILLGHSELKYFSHWIIKKDKEHVQND